jgi:hypothetical protein
VDMVIARSNPMQSKTYKLDASPERIVSQMTPVLRSFEFLVLV